MKMTSNDLRQPGLSGRPEGAPHLGGAPRSDGGGRAAAAQDDPGLRRIPLAEDISGIGGISLAQNFEARHIERSPATSKCEKQNLARNLASSVKSWEWSLEGLN